MSVILDDNVKILLPHRHENKNIWFKGDDKKTISLNYTDL